jgi:hypothetical protein
MGMDIERRALIPVLVITQIHSEKTCVVQLTVRGQ